LADLLQREITKEALSQGDRFYSVRELASRFGVSRGTAHQGLKLLADRKFVEVRPGSGTLVGPAAGHAVPTSSSSPMGVIHLILGRSGLPADMAMRMAVSNGILQAWPEASVQINMLPEKDTLTYLDRLVGKGETRSNFLGAVLGCCSREVKSYFADSGLPAVVNGDLEEHIELPYVTRNQHTIGNIAAKHLLERGHRRIGLLMYERWFPGDSHLLRGVQEAMGEARLATDALLVSSAPSHEEEEGLVRQTIEHMLTGLDRVTSIITRTDAMAIECLRSAKQLNIRVPEDVALFSAGVGDAALSDADPPITGIADITTEMGCQLAQVLMRVRRGECAGRLYFECPTEIIQRKTT
jgi:hypothetical protein